MPSTPMTAPDLLDLTRRYGLTRLQLADNLPVHRMHAAAWQALVRSAAEAGIQLELGARGLRDAHLRRYLDLAAECRSPFLRVVIDDQDYEPEMETILQTIADLLPELERTRTVLAIENHDRFTARQLADLVEATDPRWVGICLDTANSLGAGEGLVEVTRTLAPYTVNLHLKDFQLRRLSHQMGFTVSGCPLGAGLIPLPWLLEQLTATGRCVSATLELWPTPLDSLEATLAREAQWAARSVAALKAALKPV